jgi:putative endonuclease
VEGRALRGRAPAPASDRPAADRRRAEARGRRAETLAAWALRLKGWTVLARRVRVRGGEIDLVARRGRTVAFVEVKARTRDGAFAVAIDPSRIARVAAAARFVAPRYLRPGDTMRIDAVLVAPGRWPRHLPDIWQDRV